jgi:hypothetical protein
MNDRTCDVTGCERPRKTSRGQVNSLYCSMHTERIRRHGNPGTAESISERAVRAICAAPGCGKRSRNLTADYCRLHDYRWQKFGSLEKPPAHNIIDTKRCRECGYEGPDFYGYLKSVCIPCYRKYQREYDARYKAKRGYGKTREWSLRKLYGLTLADYERMLKEQSGLCAICGCPAETQRHSTLHVDHDHESGKVRGLLCNGCNRGIGYMDDRPEVLRAAAEYLERHISGD